MTVIEKKKIDFMGSEKDTGNILLGISDHLDWTESPEEHLMHLQEKLNNYLAFIESGELFENNPSAKGKNIIIEVYGKYALSEVAEKFYEGASEKIKKAGFDLKFVLFQEQDSQ